MPSRWATSDCDSRSGSDGFDVFTPIRTTSARKPSRSETESGRYCLGRGMCGLISQVAVDVSGDRNAGVPETPADDVQWDVVEQRSRGEGVPQSVDGDVTRQPSLLRRQGHRA